MDMAVLATAINEIGVSHTMTSLIETNGPATFDAQPIYVGYLSRICEYPWCNMRSFASGIIFLWYLYNQKHNVRGYAFERTRKKCMEKFDNWNSAKDA